jgi:hypothetical protein
MLIPDGYAQASFIHTISGSQRPSVCTLGFNISQAGGTLTDMALILADEWSDNVMDGLSVSVQFARLLLKAGPNATGASVEVEVGNFGTDSGPSGGPQISMVVQKITSQGGRTGRGRFYLPGVPEGAIGPDGVIAGTKVSLMQGHLDTFWDNVVANDLDPVLLHGEDTVAESPFLITNFVVQAQSVTQRRRNRK